MNLIKLKHIQKLKVVVSQFKWFQKIDFPQLYEEIISYNNETSCILDEKDFIAVNKTFPKEILIDGNSLLIFHIAWVNYENVNVDNILKLYLKRLGNP
jgi:hypothetical protein